MKRKLTAILLMLLCLAGCAGPAGINEQSSSDLSAVSSEQNGSTDTGLSGETSPDGQTTGGDIQNTSGTSPQNSTSSAATQTAATTTAPGSSMEPAKTTLAAGTVSLYINCVNAINYGIRDREGYKDIIPANGVMLDTAVKLQQSETVWSLLNRILKDNNIILNKKPGQTGYVAGIGGLKEMDCGTSSGWIYSVNGIFPLTGSNGYNLMSGDRVAFYYSVKKGDVPGKQDF